MAIKGKNILFIAPRVFGISDRIEQRLGELGAKVAFYDERPNNNFLTKALIRLNRNIIGWRLNKYYEKIIEETKHRKFDYIIFVKGEAISLNLFKRLKKLHPESKTILYLWDSIALNHNVKHLLPHFDVIYSFDRRDCPKYGLQHLPLFYYDEYSNIEEDTSNADFTLFFVGTTHTDRYRIVKTFTEQLEKKGRKVFSYFFFQGRIMFWKYLIENKESRDIDRKTVHFTSVKEKELMDLYRRSKIVLDINHPKQTGLTMRTFETLGARRKLITTNPDVVNYDFYNPANILVIDRYAPQIPDEFLDSPLEVVPEEIYEKYSLTNWLNRLLE